RIHGPLLWSDIFLYLTRYHGCPHLTRRSDSMFSLKRGLIPCMLMMFPVLAQAAEPESEFRAVWIATVANIDWPSRPGLPADEQKRELVKLLDRCQELNLNAVIFQVRPMGDAFYQSPHEPWS